MQRQRLPGTSPMQMLGQTIKLLFSALFICTVMVVIAGIFGAGVQALMIYQIMLGFFWRICLALLGIIAVLTMLDGLQ
jgi:energy-coupling factor transporter transmembrane protein EcfT